MRNVLYKNKLLAIFSVCMIVLLATRDGTLVSEAKQGIIADGSALNDNGVGYTERLQRERIAQINRRIDGYNINNL